MNRKIIAVLVLSLVMVILFSGMAAYATKANLDAEKARQIFKQRTDLFNMTEEEFMEAIKERDPAKVLFASSMAKKYTKDIDAIYKLIEENNGDFRAVSKLLMDEEDPELYQKIQQARQRQERTLEGAQQNFPVLTEAEMQNLKNEFDKKRGIDTTKGKEEKALTTEEIEALKEARQRSERTLEEAQQNFPVLTEAEMQNLKNEFDKKRGKDAANGRDVRTLTPEEIEALKEARQRPERTLEEAQQNFPVLTEAELQSLKNEYVKKREENQSK